MWDTSQKTHLCSDEKKKLVGAYGFGGTGAN